MGVMRNRKSFLVPVKTLLKPGPEMAHTMLNFQASKQVFMLGNIYTSTIASPAGSKWTQGLKKRVKLAESMGKVNYKKR